MIKIIIIINVSTVPVAVRVTAVVAVLINSAVSNSTEKKIGGKGNDDKIKKMLIK